jgi:hypothetical protein
MDEMEVEQILIFQAANVQIIRNTCARQLELLCQACQSKAGVHPLPERLPKLQMRIFVVRPLVGWVVVLIKLLFLFKVFLGPLWAEFKGQYLPAFGQSGTHS